MMVRGFLTLILALTAGKVWAQADFQPPKPPPLDPATDFEEMEEDMMEMGDEGFRPPPPPPPPGAGLPVAPPELRPQINGGGGGGSNFGANNSKVRFQLVDGEYWEKGKKRTRGKKIRASSGGGQY